MSNETERDFAFEPIPGLPERLPNGEKILWQGRPDWWALTKQAFGFWWVMGWFALLALWRFIAVSDLMPLGQALWSVTPFLIMAVVVAALLAISAYAQAKAALYTITTKRVVMRIGAALNITMNLPFVQIANADLKTFRDGTGTIVFEKMGKARISYLICWPHVKPWQFNTRPALRSIRDPEQVAALIAEHATARLNEPKIVIGAPDAAPPARPSAVADAVAAE